MTITESTQPAPSIGRNVHYQSHGTPGGEYLPAPRAAIITEVTTPLDNEFPAVSLCVLNPTGMFFNQDVPYSEEPAPGCWNWPPRLAAPPHVVTVQLRASTEALVEGMRRARDATAGVSE
ncbi:hypothetical protein [Cryobacterium cryoconiti]|uniref:hypothetical protein n=1 Tax=Cryobacterium cryoconiti TaxID=1259239 RepID=UPI0018E0BFEB|nr:hypothetical protein [Cryobacterium cryoconiti]